MTGTRDQSLIHPRERVDVFGVARSSTSYPSLREDIDAKSSGVATTKGRICIITQDFVGPVKNGGIGTAYTYAARAFAQAGFEVTVLFTISVSFDKSLEY